MFWTNFKSKTAAASRGFFATARLCCYRTCDGL